MPPSSSTTETLSWTEIPSDDETDTADSETEQEHDKFFVLVVVKSNGTKAIKFISLRNYLQDDVLARLQKIALQEYLKPTPTTAHIVDYQVKIYGNKDAGHATSIHTTQELRDYIAQVQQSSPASTCRLYAKVQKRYSFKTTKQVMLSSLNTTITPPSISMQTLVICAGVAFVIMCLAVTITCIKLLHQSPPATPNSSLTDSIKQELFHALVQHHQDHHSVPTPNHPVEQVCQGAPLSTTRPRRCFVTHDELRQAVLDYSRNPTDAQSDVAMRYGWPIGNWCVSQITDFSRIFKYSTLNEPLNHWDVSNARTVERMFYGARNMNQNLTPWNVEKVRNFRHMFAEATSFAGEVSTWNVSNAVDMDGMFDQAVSFQGDVSAWKVDRVRNMHAMFRGAVQFDSDLSRWNTAQVTDMARMFRGSGITGSLSKWSVSKVTRMDFMFEGATRFDDDLSAWDVSGVRTTKGMFLDATAFSHNLCAWGKKLPHKADAARMFEYTVSCPAPHDGKRVNKLVLAGPLPSPLCHVCE